MKLSDEDLLKTLVEKKNEHQSTFFLFISQMIDTQIECNMTCRFFPRLRMLIRKKKGTDSGNMTH
jgi:hypothetical protein